jgi:3',5'-cyclic AMP phosphodiesterase CpdA
VANGATGPSLLAASDLHVGFRDNRRIVDGMRPRHDDDWLIVAGDVGEVVEHIAWALRLLKDRFRTVVWVPGNHELWTHPSDPMTYRGQDRYDLLVELCRRLGVLTPEDPYPLWEGPGGPAYVAPLFVLYDYSFLPEGARTPAEALRLAEEAGVVCADEALLHPDPHPSRAAWCDARISATEARLAALDPAIPTVLVNHFPLVRQPTDVLRFPEFAQWCGTERTADWPQRFRAEVVVYGHLHIPRTALWDGVRHEEVSLGYPREWNRRDRPPGQLRQILPTPELPPTGDTLSSFRRPTP